MNRRTINLIVLVFFVVGGLYYAVTDNEAQGTVVVLLGILYFVASPHI